MRLGAREGFEIDIVDRALAVAINKINEAAPDPPDGRQVQLHGPGRPVKRAGAEPGGPFQRPARVAHAHGEGAHRRPVDLGEGLGEAVRLLVQDEVDVTLPVQDHLLRAVARDGLKAHALEELRQGLHIAGRVFDELEAVRPHRVLEIVSTVCPSPSPPGYPGG